MSSPASTGEAAAARQDVGRRAARGTAYLMGAQAVSMASGYVVAVVLARGLGPERYGVYGLVISVLLATELIGRMGVPQVASKLIAEGRLEARGLERTSLTLTLLIYLLITLLFALAAPALARSFEIEDGARLFWIAALDIPFYGMLFATQHVLNGERRFGAESLGVSLYGVSKALGVVALLYLGLSVESALLANLAASVIGLGYFASRLSAGAFRPSLEFARPLLRMALPTALLVVASQVLANLDLWCLKWVEGADGSGAIPTTETTIGLYVAATNIARLPSVVHFVMTAVLIPSVSRLASTDGPAAVTAVVRPALRFLLLLLAPACVWLALRSEELMRLVYDEEYVSGAGLQAVLVIRFGLVTTLMMTLSSVLLALGKPGVAARGMWLAIPLGWLVLVPAIGHYGGGGAAVGGLATLVLAMLFTGRALWRELGALVEARALLFSALAVGLVFLSTRWYAPGGWWLPLDGLLNLGLVLALHLLLGGLRLEELRSFLGGGGKGKS